MLNKNIMNSDKITDPKFGHAYFVRLIDEGSSESKGISGSYWSYELPKNKAQWRKDYAVKDSWNDNGYYVEHTVGPEGLKVWEGKTAGQKYSQAEGDADKYYLEGGNTQIFVKRGALDDIQVKPTNWPDANL